MSAAFEQFEPSIWSCELLFAFVSRFVFELVRSLFLSLGRQEPSRGRPSIVVRFTLAKNKSSWERGGTKNDQWMDLGQLRFHPSLSCAIDRQRPNPLFFTRRHGHRPSGRKSRKLSKPFTTAAALTLIPPSSIPPSLTLSNPVNCSGLDSGRRPSGHGMAWPLLISSAK